MTQITLPAAVKTIGEGAFYGCERLSSLTLPNSISIIEQDAFKDIASTSWMYGGILEISNVNNWAKIQFGNYYANPMSASGINNLSVNGDVVKHLDLDLGDTEVSDYAFYGAKGIESVRIKASGIGDSSFNWCSGIKNICIDTDELGEAVFSGCSAVENIYVLRSNPPVAPDYAFSKYDGVNLYVPVGCVSAYENSESCWWKFLDVYESDFSGLDKIFKADYENSDAGVDEILFDNHNNLNCPNDIYNMQGVCIKRNATQADIDTLAPGLYIIVRK